jgi:hypothetical protein
MLSSPEVRGQRPALRRIASNWEGCTVGYQKGSIGFKIGESRWWAKLLVGIMGTGGLCGLLRTKAMESATAWIWSEVLPWPSWIASHLGLVTWSAFHWAFFGFGVFSLGRLVLERLDRASYLSYRYDVLFGVPFFWEYEGGSVRNPFPLCPRCAHGLTYKANAPNDYDYGNQAVLACPNCHASYRVDIGLLPLEDRIRGEIERRLVTKSWDGHSERLRSLGPTWSEY